MITCEYMGRLGNNMFQIATTYATAKKYNDIAEFSPHPDMPHLPIRSTKPDNEFIGLNNRNQIYDIPHKKNMTLVGFFQRHEYFDFVKDELIEKVFNVPNDWQPNTIAIHVRRGDFLFDPFNFPPVSVEYINKAISLMPENKRIVFLSDDMNWCIENFSNLPKVEFRINTSPMSDIFYMANCDNVIMSNSTFSFWGAYLSNRKRQIVFPLHWFAKTSGRDGYEICPKEWKGI